MSYWLLWLSVAGCAYTLGLYICVQWVLFINMNEYPFFFLVAFLAEVIPINSDSCSHLCLLGVLLGRETTRMASTRAVGRHPQAL
jgi:hypothetical protein